MAKILRGYQQRLITGIYTKWQQGARVVGATLATGGGKTPIKARLAQELGGRGIIQAHRSELVGQISTALGSEGLRHNIIASQKTIRAIVDTHLQELGHSMYDPRASWCVASTDTIVKNGIPGADHIDWHFIDEGHHVLRDNKWGKAYAMTPRARGLFMTATSGRADGKGWGANYDGLVNALEQGPGAGELIRNGYLCSYEVAACRAADLDLSDVEQGTDGDHNKAQVQRAVKRSKKIIGDIVENYQRWALGKQAILFAVDIEHAGQIVSALQAAGMKAELVHGSTEEGTRRRVIKQFRNREIQVLVNVDLFGEGFDVPGVEVVIMARPTLSFPLFCQMIGRMLRLAVTRLEMDMWETFSVAERLAIIARSPKPKALLIDHVGNVYQTWKIGQLTFGGPHAPVLPEGFTNWAAGMERRNKRASKVQDGIPMRSCETWYEPDRTEHKGCWQSYERTLDACPYCGNDIPPPAQRGTPQQVDGDIFLLDPEVLAKMRGEVARIDDRAYVPQGVDSVAARAIMLRHHERQTAQHHLRNAIAVWAGRYPGKSEAYLHKLFWFTYGQTVISAASLGASDADALRAKLEAVA